MANQVPVLWCQQCNKPFTKQSALKRHGYYCRSRTTGTPLRRRSCTACAQAKTGCDKENPQCSRCVQKGLICQYPSGDTSQKGEATASNALQRTVANGIDLCWPDLDQDSTFHDITPANDSRMLLDDALSLHSDSFSNPTASEYEPWTVDDLEARVGGFMSSNHSYLSPCTTSSSSSMLLPSTDPAIQEQPNISLQSRQQQRNSNFHSIKIPIPPVPSANVRSIVKQPSMHTGKQSAGNLLFYSMKSYPLMLRQNTLPPFVHPACVSFTDGNTATEPLANCITLIRMMASEAKGSRELFWRNVQHECNRLCHQTQTLSRWDLLGAMQALSIYVLIRLDEGETDHNNLDQLMERAVILVASQLSQNDMDRDRRHASWSGSENNWQDWVYKESRRRLAVIYRLLNKFTFFGLAALCEMPADFMIAPLPAKKQLWEAENAHTWELKVQKERRALASYALAVDGEIVQLDERRLSYSDAWVPYLPPADDVGSQPQKNGKSRNVGGWVEWCSGMDGLGGLILLAASMA